ncbi:hypothetical protein [Fulvivirga sediminis]|uniref:Uncharacterized protein n=1 Tax=Fulvivirga sediminis TaxID=2803949 RepID=A0A937FBZ8_9BACT|nr:hypothetical protein [Fulvivirga sediminis]MBL3658882.1 hypothetical protein [Fulvivirga sediminis]
MRLLGLIGMVTILVLVNYEKGKAQSTLKSYNNEQKQAENNFVDQSKYDGQYILMAANDCQLQIDISGGIYHLETSKRKLKGTIEILKNNQQVYLLFKRLIGDDPGEDVSGKYEDNSIIIQNYGNSMNQYTRLSECSDKYLVLKKR